MIQEFVNPKIVSDWATAQEALVQELLREAQQQASPAPQGETSETLLTPDELAQKLSVPRSWVYEQSRQGKLPTHRIGRYVRFRLSEVLEHQRQRHASEAAGPCATIH